MKAVIIRKHGEIECVAIEDIPRPEPANSEILVEVRAAALNHLDIWMRRGRPGLNLKMPHVLGSDAAGIVAAVGPNSPWKVGAEVILNPALSCGCCRVCLGGAQNLCESFGIIGQSRSGAFAQWIAVPAENVFPKPAHLDFTQAAALSLDHLTAWHMVVRRARVTPGECVLIHGVGGGAALAALQIAVLMGAQTIVTSSSDAKLDKAKSLGAHHTVNYKTTPDLARAIRDLSAGLGVDVVIDTVGAATWPIDLQVVRRGGRVVLCGVTTGAQAQTDLRLLYWNQLTLMGSTMGSPEDFHHLLQAVSLHRLKPVVDSVFPLDQARQAMQRMETGVQFGKIVLDMKA